MSKPLPDKLERALYPLHLVIRGLAFVLVLLLELFAMFVTGFVSVLFVSLVWSYLSDSPFDHLIKQLGIPIVGLFASLSLFGALLKNATSSAKTSLHEIPEAFAAMKPSCPPRDWRRSLAETRCYSVTHITCTMPKLFRLSFRLFRFLTSLVLLFLYFYAQAISDNESRQDIQEILRTVKELQANP